MENGRPIALALDAMGVIFRDGDDVADLLVPFVASHGGSRDAAFVEERYRSASLGELTAEEFWQSVGLSPDLENAYLVQYRLNDGAAAFLEQSHELFSRVCCVTNDVSEWSRKLRRRFGLDRAIERWFVSGDIGWRKPDAAIYERVLRDLRVPAERLVFVDDRLRNVQAAAALGIISVVFGQEAHSTGWEHAVRDFAELAALCREW
jgi:putative hydrolase of the HAD superfamily